MNRKPVTRGDHRRMETFAQELDGLEKKVATRIFRVRQRLSHLIKLKDYATMNRCNFRSEQIKKLLKGEENGKNW